MSDNGLAAKGCPTVKETELLKKANKKYDEEETGKFAYMASLQEAACYANRHQQPYIMQPCKTRIIEICEFAGRMKYKRLGLAFCIGLAKEAKIVEDILTRHKFKVISVACKAGRTSKDLLGIKEEDKINRGVDESMCNPIFQAMLLNDMKVEFNILLGLCVGHDSLFFKYSDVPTTVLAVKDRVTGHNPLAAIYLSDSYYQKIKHPGI
jgi:uncharacterized metal-binding protein